MATMGHGIRTWVASGCAALAFTCVSAEASALEPGFTWSRGTINGGPRFATDNLNLGLGVNGGYTLPMGVYLGGLFDAFIGEKDEFQFGPTRVEADFWAWLLMFDAGYDLGLAPNFVLRPSFALGLSTVHVEVCTTGPGFNACDDDTDSDTQAAIGANALYNTGSLTIGGEVRLFFADFDGIWFGFNIGGVL